MFPDDDSVEVARYNPGPILLRVQVCSQKNWIRGSECPNSVSGSCQVTQGKSDPYAGLNEEEPKGNSGQLKTTDAGSKEDATHAQQSSSHMQSQHLNS